MAVETYVQRTSRVVPRDHRSIGLLSSVWRIGHQPHTGRSSQGARLTQAARLCHPRRSRCHLHAGKHGEGSGQSVLTKGRNYVLKDLMHWRIIFAFDTSTSYFSWLDHSHHRKLLTPPGIWSVRSSNDVARRRPQIWRMSLYVAMAWSRPRWMFRLIRSIPKFTLGVCEW